MHRSYVQAICFGLFLFLFCFACFTPAYAGDDHLNFSTDGNGNISISVEGEALQGTDDAFATVLGEYKTIAVGVTGICAITACLSMLFQITRLGAAGDNDRARRLAMGGILFSGFALALFGGATIIVGFFWNAFI